MMMKMIMNDDNEPGPSQRPGPNLLRVLQPCQGGLPQDHEEEVPWQGITTGSVHLYCTVITDSLHLFCTVITS